jgi:hypothetical protein
LVAAYAALRDRRNLWMTILSGLVFAQSLQLRGVLTSTQAQTTTRNAAFIAGNLKSLTIVKK